MTRNVDIRNLSSEVGGQFDSLESTTKAFVKTFQAKVTATLAVGLWSLFTLSVLWHIFMIQKISLRYIDIYQETLELGIEDQRYSIWEEISKSSDLVNDTAKTLYAVLSPLATAVTGFYFSSSSQDGNSPEQ